VYRERTGRRAFYGHVDIRFGFAAYLVSLSEGLLSTRDLGAVGIKLIGVFFGASGVMRLVAVVASTALPQVERLPSAAIVRLNLFTIVVELAIAAAFLFRGDALAGRLFSDRRLQRADVSRKDLLILGLALFGVSAEQAQRTRAVAMSDV
jgi:hypothetical protein